MTMSGEEQTPVNDDTSLIRYIDSVFCPTADASPRWSFARIPRVKEMARKKEEHYERYFVPKVVSIGPYHHGNEKLQAVQILKPRFTMKLLKDDTEARMHLYKTLGQPGMVESLKGYYEEGSCSTFSDMDFTNMMVLDACFILYCIRSIFGGKYQDCPELKNNEIFYIHQDLFLLENQIPYKVLKQVMNLVPEIDWSKIKMFIYSSILASGRPRHLKWLKRLIDDESEDNVPDHLFQLLHNRLVDTFKVETKDSTIPENVRCNFRNVSELVEVGIHFKPSDYHVSPPYIMFNKGRWDFSANVALPPITVNDTTKPILLNLMAYEACWYYITDAWVTSYVCLLDSLIDDAEDVKVLRKAWVLENSLSSDSEVARLFNELSSDLAPNKLAYMDAKNKIQRHYESRRITLFSQLKNEYFKSPWAIFALLGALIALFFTGVQAYFTVWSREGPCEHLCKFLWMNHHL